MIKAITDYVSKEASIPDWLSGIGTFAAVLIALSPQIGRILFGIFPPKVIISIAGKGNVVISSDGKIHKLQIPYQIENEGMVGIFIEEMQLTLRANEDSYEMPWRKFVSDVQGSATAPISNPYRFMVESKNTSEKFVEFLTEEDIHLSKLTYWIETKVLFSFTSRVKQVLVRKRLEIDDAFVAQIKLNSKLAEKNGKPLLVGFSLQN